jgi:hypothetical protein
VASRLLALLICLSACVGISLELMTLMKGGKSVLASAWWLVGYFTILTNGLVAILFGAVALHGKAFDHPRLIAGAALSIALVGVVFALLLQGLRTLAGATVLANFLLHQLNPVLVPAAWLLTVRKGVLSWRDPFLWALYPLGYFVYALTRGFAQGSFAYPFIDVAVNGWAQVGVNALAIALGFIAAGELLVWIDRRLAATARK